MPTEFDQTTGQVNITPRRIVVDDARSGGDTSLTRAAIQAWTKSDIESLFNKESGMDRVISQTKEAQMCGVQERGLSDLILSKHATLTERKGQSTDSVIQPFCLVPRRNQVNANYFKVTGTGSAVASLGTWADPAATTLSAEQKVHLGLGVSWPAAALQVQVAITDSPWVSAPNAGLADIYKYFLPGSNVSIEFTDTDNVARQVQYKILFASGGTLCDLVLEPNITSAYDTYRGTNNSGSFANVGPVGGELEVTYTSSADVGFQKAYLPTNGVAVLTGNSISDYENYGEQYPAINNLTLAEYWQQTFRWAFSYSEEYVKALGAPLTADTWKKFKTLPLAQQRRQVEAFVQNQLLNAVFYGQRLNEKQTVEGYTDLQKVFDPTWMGGSSSFGSTIEYKSNTVGARTQLAEAGRVYDKQAGPLVMDDIFAMCYNLKRYREGQGESVSTIDCMTDRATKAVLRDKMIAYYAAKYTGTNVNAFFKPGELITDWAGTTVFEYDIYDLPDEGVKLAVFTDTYFDDKLSAFASGDKARGRSLWFIDWGDIAINVLKTNSVKRTTNEADELYRHVITPNVTQTMLNSKTVEVRVGDPNRSVVYENFDAAPTAPTV